jgi:hypothetical protein
VVSIDKTFSSRQSKRRKIQGQEEICGEMQFRMNIMEGIDSLLTQIQCRFESVCEISSEFSSLHGDTLCFQSVDDLKKSAVKFARKYKDVSEVEHSSEIESFKYSVASAAPNFSDTEPISLLNLIHQLDVCDTYPNIEIALRIFLTLPVTVASCERSFSTLRLIKNYLRSAQNQEHTSNLGIYLHRRGTGSAVKL